jgi:hypothetical protein
MTITINIAGIQILIDSAVSFKVNKKINCFSSTACQAADLTVSLTSCEEITIPVNSLAMDEIMYWSRDADKADNTSIYIKEPETGKAIYRLLADKAWKKAEISYCQDKRNILTPFLESLGEILFRNSLLFHQGMVIHAAAIEWKGQGIIFSAPSGTGKTTQANLWRKYKGARIINADRPAVRAGDTKSFVYGTLWNGSSEKYKNRCLPLIGIILLEQAEENHIRRLDAKEAAAKLMPRCFLPYYEADIMELAFKNIEKIIALTPVYLLKCRPDGEAVEIVYQCLK